MALLICPECKKNVSSDANECPHCGYKLTDEIKSNALLKAKKTKKGCLVALFIFITMFIVIVIFTPTQKPSKTYKSKPKAFIYENRPIYSVPDSTSEIYQITSDYGLLIFVYKDKDGWTAFYNPFFNNDSLRYVQTKYVTYDENKLPIEP